MLTFISISVPPPCYRSSMHVKYPGHSAEVAVLGSLSLIVLMISVDVKQHLNSNPEMSALRSCVKVEVAVLGSPSLIVLVVSVDYLALNIEHGPACRRLPQGWLLVVDDL